LNQIKPIEKTPEEREEDERFFRYLRQLELEAGEDEDEDEDDTDDDDDDDDDNVQQNSLFNVLERPKPNIVVLSEDENEESIEADKRSEGGNKSGRRVRFAADTVFKESSSSRLRRKIMLPALEEDYEAFRNAPSIDDEKSSSTSSTKFSAKPTTTSSLVGEVKEKPIVEVDSEQIEDAMNLLEVSLVFLSCVRLIKIRIHDDTLGRNGISSFA
jgi:hypothetical protein